jgi:hypothetical protein
MAALVPAWLPAGSKASFDVMRVSTFPGGIARRSPSSAQCLEKNPAISACSLVNYQESRAAAFFDGSF